MVHCYVIAYRPTSQLAQRRIKGGEKRPVFGSKRFVHISREDVDVDDASGVESRAQMNYTVCELLKTACLNITLDQ